LDNKKIAFDVARDKDRIKKVINLCKEKGIPFVDRDGLLGNKM
jgi:hypothetical protein